MDISNPIIRLILELADEPSAEESAALSSYSATKNQIDWQKLYDDALPQMEELYGSMSEDEQTALETLDQQFFDGNREPLIRWAQRMIPGSFEVKSQEQPQPQATKKVQPFYKPDYRYVWHGTNALNLILRNGICTQPANTVYDDMFAWDSEEYMSNAGMMNYDEDSDEFTFSDEAPYDWGFEVFAWYKELSDSEKSQIESNAGMKIRSQENLGAAISLLWVYPHRPEHKDFAGHGGKRVVIDLEQLSYYDILEDEYAGQGAKMIIMPTTCPQAPPSAIVGLQ